MITHYTITHAALTGICISTVLSTFFKLSISDINSSTCCCNAARSALTPCNSMFAARTLASRRRTASPLDSSLWGSVSLSHWELMGILADANMSVKLLSLTNMLAFAPSFISHAFVSWVDRSLGDGIGVTIPDWGVPGSTSVLSFLHDLCSFSLFLSRLRFAFCIFFDPLLTRFGKSGVGRLTLGLDCPGGGVITDWLRGITGGGVRNPDILVCTIAIM